MIDLPPFDALALSLHHSPGTHAILVGSGLSRAAGIPSGWEITLDLIRRLAALDGVTEHDDWPKWYHDKYGKGPAYSEILDALASTAAERRAILHSYIDPPADGESRIPTKAHKAIAQLVASGAVRVIITTNFDRLIENALREAGIEPTVIASDDAITGATPLVHATCTVIKVNGDYLDARIKNTEIELESYSPAMNALLDQVFDHFGLLVVGWSGDWDTALRAAFLRSSSRRYPFYWAAHGSIGGLAQDLLDHRGGRSFPISDADTFFVKLEGTLDALKQASRPHPQSVEMAIALAKRYCRDDRFAMEWAEFLYDEVEKIRAYVKGSDYPSAYPTDVIFNETVQRLTAKSELLRRACLICGRWGTDEANRAVARAIQSLSFAADSVGGFDIWNSLREFGASVCFYWNLGGLLEREAWPLIPFLLESQIKLTSSKTEVAVTELPFLLYGSVNWKLLSGLDRRHTPISDYLGERFESEAKDISLTNARGAELFDQVELTIALAYGHRRLNKEGSWFWMPVGRFIWKREGEGLDRELKRIEQLPDDDAFFKAGILGNSKANTVPTLLEVRKFRQQIAGHYW